MPLFTVATEALLVDHVIVLFVAALVIRNNTRNAIRYYEEVIVDGTISTTDVGE